VKLLFKFNVFGQEIPVYKAKLPDEFAGAYVPAEKKIVLSDSLKENSEDFLVTLIHELGHAMCDRLGLRNMPSHNDDWEEILVDNYATMLCENLSIALPKTKRRKPSRKVRRRSTNTK